MKTIGFIGKRPHALFAAEQQLASSGESEARLTSLVSSSRLSEVKKANSLKSEKINEIGHGQLSLVTGKGLLLKRISILTVSLKMPDTPMQSMSFWA